MNRELKISALLAIISAILFIPFTGRLHLFDWDEINFAESAREMLLTGDYLTVKIFFKPFWEKPPLFIWLQALCMKVFGVNEFSARLPNALAGVFTILVLFKLGSKLKNEKFGIIWAVAYGTSILPFLYFKSGIIDPWFNLFIFLGVVHYIYAQEEILYTKKYLWISGSAFFIGMAVLTKGPVAILIFGLTTIVLLVYKRFRLLLRTGHVLVFAFVLIITGGFWFILQVFAGNWQTIIDFVVYQIRLFSEKDAGHGGFPLYHFIVLFFGVFPASVFVIQAHKKNNDNNKTAYFKFAMLALFWVVLILFSIVKTKIVHYSSLCYFPMSFLAAYSVYNYIQNKTRVPHWINWIVGIVSSLIGIIIVGFPIFDKYKHWFIQQKWITHPFTVGNLQADVGWTGFEVLIGILFIVGIQVGIGHLRKVKNLNGFSWIAISSVLFIYSAVLFITPKVEKYSQNSAIEFFKSLKGKDVYVNTFYKSYAMLFYTGAVPQENEEVFNLGWLVSGNIDKNAYFVIRADKKNETLNRYQEVKVLYEKNGYVFCIRKAKLEKKEKQNDKQ
jgi:4-amino-4-deoxy-L-arabinose transferase-like glycosyltransferase